MKPKRIKAVLGEAGGDGVEILRLEWTLPADAESYERMVEQMAHAIDPEAKELCEHFECRMRMGSSEPWYDYRKEADDKARAALRAIGITAPKRGKKGSQ